MNEIFIKGLLEKHYYTLFSQNLQGKLTIQYIELQNLNSEKEKALMWLLIEFSQKELDFIIESIITNLDIYDRYSQHSYFKSQYHDIRDKIRRLMEVDYEIHGDYIDKYKQFVIAR
jgi:tagatose-1,6-bisphosphate aldolase